ncbi:hypothetical protein DF186_22690, partial [Enterococcus hirae]
IRAGGRGRDAAVAPDGNRHHRQQWAEPLRAGGVSRHLRDGGACAGGAGVHAVCDSRPVAVDAILRGGQCRFARRGGGFFLP